MKTNINNVASFVGQRIRRARQKAGLSQQDLGEKVFKTGAAIGYIERGKRGINVEDLVLFSEVLNVPITYFFVSKISEELLLQETLDKLENHVTKLHSSIKQQSKVIETLMTELPRTEELRLITESSIDPILLISRQGEIIYATRSIHEFLGIHASKIVGLSCKHIVATDKLSECTDMLERIFADKRIVHYETELKHANGHFIDVEINARVFKKDGKPIAHVVIRDISDRKTIQKKLLQKEQESHKHAELYRLLLDQSSEAVFLETAKEKIIDVNHQATQITGYSREELLGMKTSDLKGGSKNNKKRNEIYSSNKQAVTSFEDMLRQKSGATIPIRVAISSFNFGTRRLFLSQINRINKTAYK